MEAGKVIINFKPLPSTEVVWSICESCGAVVLISDQDVHRRWHQGIKQDIGRAAKTYVDPPTY